MNEFILALSYLTLLPTNSPTEANRQLGRAARFFPLVGLLLGVLLSSAHFVFATFFNPLLAATLTVSAWVTLTGGKHIIGLTRSLESFPAPVERRLEILRGPNIGGLGMAGLCLLLIAKVTTLATLPSGSVLLALYGATLFARWLIVMVAQRPVARTGGVVDELARGLTRETLVLATLLPAAFILFGAVEVRVLIAGGFAYLSAWLIGWLAQTRLGGITDEVLGLTVEVAELVFLLAFAAQIILASPV
ncbi:MAG: adenosylcobinamide-GDP ribazoletransferase [Anaerolineales bacterium]|nr:adenosylcobinamide-GDP ribazoletransferase [Anaerolineales bacterium]